MSRLLWMDEIHFAPPKNHGKPLFVGILQHHSRGFLGGAGFRLWSGLFCCFVEGTPFQVGVQGKPEEKHLFFVWGPYFESDPNPFFGMVLNSKDSFWPKGASPSKTHAPRQFKLSSNRGTQKKGLRAKEITSFWLHQ